MISGVLKALVNHSLNSNEQFGDGSSEVSYFGVVVSLVLLVVWLTIVLLIGKFLWNSSAVPLLSFAKPATSVWPILGLHLLVGMLYGR